MEHKHHRRKEPEQVRLPTSQLSEKEIELAQQLNAASLKPATLSKVLYERTQVNLSRDQVRKLSKDINQVEGTTLTPEEQGSS